MLHHPVDASHKAVLARLLVGVAVLHPELLGDPGEGPLVLGDEFGVSGIDLLATPALAFGIRSYVSFGVWADRG